MPWAPNHVLARLGQMPSDGLPCPNGVAQGVRGAASLTGRLRPNFGDTLSPRVCNSSARIIAVLCQRSRWLSRKYVPIRHGSYDRRALKCRAPVVRPCWRSWSADFTSSTRCSGFFFLVPPRSLPMHRPAAQPDLASLAHNI